MSSQQNSRVKRASTPEASNLNKMSSQRTSHSKSKQHHSHKPSNDKEFLKSKEKLSAEKEVHGTHEIATNSSHSPLQANSEKPSSYSKDTKRKSSSKDEKKKLIQKSNGEKEPGKSSDLKRKNSHKRDESQLKPENSSNKHSSRASIKDFGKNHKNNSRSSAKDDDNRFKRQSGSKRTKENGRSLSNSRVSVKDRLGLKAGKKQGFFKQKVGQQRHPHNAGNSNDQDSITENRSHDNRSPHKISDQLRLHRFQVRRKRLEIADKIKKEKERLSVLAQKERYNPVEPDSSYLTENPWRRLHSPIRDRSPSHDLRVRSWDREQDDLISYHHPHRSPQSRRSGSRSGDLYPAFHERRSPHAWRARHKERHYDRLSQASDHRSDHHNYDRSSERVSGDFSERGHSRRDDRAYSRGSGRNCDDVAFEKCENYRDGWPPRERGMRSRSGSRIRLHRSVSRGGGINYTSRSRSRSRTIERYNNRQGSYHRSRSRSRSRSHKHYLHRRHSKMEDRRSSERTPETNRKRRRTSSNKEEALNNLWEIHSKECDMYRKNPDAHPDYFRTKREWMAEKVRLGFNTMDPSIHVQWVQYWLVQMEELFKKSWEEKKTECLMLLFSKSLLSQTKDSPRRRSVRSTSSSSSNSSRSYSSSSSSDSRPSRKRSKKQKKHKKKSKKSKKNKHPRKRSDDEGENTKTVDEIALMEDLESRVNDFIERSRPRDKRSSVIPESPAGEMRNPGTSPSATLPSSGPLNPAPPPAEVEALLDLTSYLNQLSDRLGALAVSLASLHDRVIDCVKKGQDPFQCIDSDAKALLDCTRNKLLRILEKESVTPVQSALYTEANQMIDKFLNSLKEPETPSVVSSDLQVIAKMTLEMKMPQIIAFIKNLNSKAGVDFSSDELMRTYLEIKRIQRTLTTLVKEFESTETQYMKDEY